MAFVVTTKIDEHLYYVDRHSQVMIFKTGLEAHYRCRLGIEM